MLTSERKKEMVVELKNYLQSSSHADFGRKLGITPQNAFVWQERGSFNAELIIEKYPEISGDWLLTGEGPMLRKNRIPSVNQEPDITVSIRKAIDAIAEEQRHTATAQAQTDKLLELAKDLSRSLANLSPLE